MDELGIAYDELFYYLKNNLTKSVSKKTFNKWFSGEVLDCRIEPLVLIADYLDLDVDILLESRSCSDDHCYDDEFIILGSEISKCFNINNIEEYHRKCVIVNGYQWLVAPKYDIISNHYFTLYNSTIVSNDYRTTPYFIMNYWIKYNDNQKVDLKDGFNINYKNNNLNFDKHDFLDMNKVMNNSWNIFSYIESCLSEFISNDYGFDSKSLTNSEKIGKRLSYIRREKKMTAEDLAYRVGVTRETINNWESGKCSISIAHTVKIKEVLGILIKYLFSDYFYKKINIHQWLISKYIYEVTKFSNLEDFKKQYQVVSREGSIILPKKNFYRLEDETEKIFFEMKEDSKNIDGNIDEYLLIQEKVMRFIKNNYYLNTLCFFCDRKLSKDDILLSDYIYTDDTELFIHNDDEKTYNSVYKYAELLVNKLYKIKYINDKYQYY